MLTIIMHVDDGVDHHNNVHVVTLHVDDLHVDVHVVTLHVGFTLTFMLTFMLMLFHVDVHVDHPHVGDVGDVRVFNKQGGCHWTCKVGW